MGGILSTCGKDDADVVECLEQQPYPVQSLHTENETLKRSVARLKEDKLRLEAKISKIVTGESLVSTYQDSIEELDLSEQDLGDPGEIEIDFIHSTMAHNPMSLVTDLWEDKLLHQLQGVRVEGMRITALDLTSTSLAVIPSNIRLLGNLEIMILSHNSLQALPEEIGELKNLTTVYLDHNCFQSFPEALCKLKRLQFLWIHRNKLRQLPKSIGQMHNLRQLLVHENRLEHIPDELKDLRHLKSIWLQKNCLKHIPIWFGDLTGSVKS